MTKWVLLTISSSSTLLTRPPHCGSHSSLFSTRSLSNLFKIQEGSCHSFVEKPLISSISLRINGHNLESAQEALHTPLLSLRCHPPFILPSSLWIPLSSSLSDRHLLLEGCAWAICFAGGSSSNPHSTLDTHVVCTYICFKPLNITIPIKPTPTPYLKL